MELEIKHLFIDLFCGAGGTTTGVHEAEENGGKIAEVAVCVNHDKNAILSHSSNYPECKHFTEDIRTVSMEKIMHAVRQRINHWEILGYKVIIHLWASLECTNFSKAKGGLPRNADSRTLAEHLFRYIDFIKPDYVRVENVEEFMSWGPLDEKGKPLSKDEGKDYINWIGDVQDRGYRYDYKILNSADFGEHTSRKRYFGVFAYGDLPISWPQPTHAKNPESPLFGSVLKKWNPVKYCLDFSDEGKSIFNRKKDLSEKTLQRILAGLVKYVAGGKKAFLAKYNSYNLKSGAQHCAADIDKPCPVVSTQNRIGIVNANFLTKYYSGRPEGKVSDVESPAGTLTTSDRMSLIQTKFLTKYYGKGENAKSVDDVCPTITNKDRFSLIQPAFWMDKQFTNEYNHQSLDQPAGSILANDKHSLVRAEHFIDKQFSSGGRDQSVEDPAGSLLTVPKMNLIKCWIMNTNFSNVGSSSDAPLSTITANRKWHYLMNPSWGGNTTNTEDPCFTLIARQDKAPAYVVMAEECSNLAIAVYENDSETMVKIKEFMTIYNIVDIKMRMLKVVELLKIQGFPTGYTLIGNQTDQKKFIGNSVTPKPVKYMIEECHISLKKLFNVAA
jgi:DNA (cytosine-5)-methyltransferase 1